jgi:hypothetical protein
MQEKSIGKCFEREYLINREMTDFIQWSCQQPRCEPNQQLGYHNPHSYVQPGFLSAAYELGDIQTKSVISPGSS